MKSVTAYSIKTAAKLSGLSPFVIRAWERRYHVLTPQRTDTNRRVYSEDDVEKLRLLGDAVKNGNSISNIARLSVEDLKKLNTAAGRFSPAKDFAHPDAAGQSLRYLKDCLNSIREYDSVQLESTLQKAAIELGLNEMLSGLVIPLIGKIGEDWYNGTMRIAQEHMASSVLVAFLKNLRSRYKVSSYAPAVVTGTPKGQMHELGSLLAALIAASEGWNVVELGPSLPAEEIAAAAKYSDAKAICLSIVYPDEEIIPKELKKLGKLLKKEAAVIVGGRAAHLYKSTIEKEGFLLIEDFGQFRKALAEAVK